MTTEIATRTDSNLVAEMDYARAVSSASMLPETYRGKPADIMLAVGLGQSMGLSPAESLYRIAVIKGKPTASAELIAANVRKAGHRLRVLGDDSTCTATIIRADDPDFEFTVTRDMDWAKKMGLAGNQNYTKQPGTMLQWRAITAVARLACPEALYGVAYTPDEMYDLGGAPAPTSQASGRERLAQAAAATVPDEPAATPESDTLSDDQRKKIMALAGDLGLDRDQRLAGCSSVAGREITTTNDLTKAEASQVIERMQARLNEAAEVIDAELVDTATETLPTDGEAS